MSEFEAFIFLLIVITILLVGYFVISRFHVTNVKRFQLIVSFLGGISALLIAYSIYINIRTNKVIEDNRLAYNTITNTYRNFLEPQKELLDVYPEGFFLYASTQPESDLLTLAPKNFDPIKRAQVELYGSYRLVQTMEDFLSTARYDIGGIAIWVNVFIMWLQSPILQTHWKKIAHQYDPDTRKFVDRLIEKANYLNELRKKKGNLSAQDYDEISSKFKVAYR